MSPPPLAAAARAAGRVVLVINKPAANSQRIFSSSTPKTHQPPSSVVVIFPAAAASKRERDCYKLFPVEQLPQCWRPRPVRKRPPHVAVSERQPGTQRGVTRPLPLPLLLVWYLVVLPRGGVVRTAASGAPCSPGSD